MRMKQKVKAFDKDVDVDNMKLIEYTFMAGSFVFFWKTDFSNPDLKYIGQIMFYNLFRPTVSSG